ncbi:MAG: phosphate ABC transporter permease PstA [Oscillospiraceae bacterium]|jgi:phosphate transport system permease protein|nr:phosphate ABC transporter permease PstA [Oscillospiraceae bacterium]
MSNSITGKRKRPGDILLYGVIGLFTAAVFAMTVYFVVYIFSKGLRGLSLAFLTTAPNPIIGTLGILPSIINTAYIILLTLVFAVPIGVGGAVYINEYAKSRKLIRVIEFTTETLSGIPSIIFGVFGNVFFCVFLNLKVSLLSGALTLTIMVLPTIIRTAQEALKAVPVSYREGAAGLGASKWTMIRTILLPNASGGIITAVVLSVGRIVGESAALLLVAGGSAMYLPRGSFFQQIQSSGSTLAVELYRYAYSRGENEVGFAIAALLLIIVIGLNLAVKLIGKRINRGAK